MEKTFAARVLDEQHVVEQRHQPFAQAASARSAGFGGAEAPCGRIWAALRGAKG